MKTFQAPFVHGLSIAEKKRPPTVMVGGFLMGWNQAISCLNMSGGSARESNPPTPLVTRHNGFEVRCYSYQGVRLVPPSWEITPGLYQYVLLVGCNREKFGHFCVTFLAVQSVLPSTLRSLGTTIFKSGQVC